MAKYLVEGARGAGDLVPGAFRVMVDMGGSVRHRDFPSLDAAKDYADDIASDGDDPHAIALVLDAWFEVVYRGQHYAGAR